MARRKFREETTKEGASYWRRPLAWFTAALLLLSSGEPVLAEASRVLWAWERPEHLLALPPGVGVAASGVLVAAGVFDDDGLGVRTTKG